MPQIKRSLYDCANARVAPSDNHDPNGVKIYCSKGFFFYRIGVLALYRGAPLEQTVCQDCKHFEKMGPRLKPEDRGWKNLINAGTQRGDKNG